MVQPVFFPPESQFVRCIIRLVSIRCLGSNSSDLLHGLAAIRPARGFFGCCMICTLARSYLGLTSANPILFCTLTLWGCVKDILPTREWANVNLHVKIR